MDRTTVNWKGSWYQLVISLSCANTVKKNGTLTMSKQISKQLFCLTSTMAKMVFDNIPRASFAMRDLSEDTYCMLGPVPAQSGLNSVVPMTTTLPSSTSMHKSLSCHFLSMSMVTPHSPIQPLETYGVSISISNQSTVEAKKTCCPVMGRSV